MMLDGGWWLSPVSPISVVNSVKSYSPKIDNKCTILFIYLLKTLLKSLQCRYRLSGREGGQERQ